MKVFGLLGKELSYSFSPKYFKEKFSETGFEGMYLTFEIPNEKGLSNFLAWAKIALSGLNVTIPYKEAVIPFLDELSNEAYEIKAVNCIEITEDGKLIGQNTDYLGFLDPISTFFKEGTIQKALVLGTGGASKAVEYALKEKGVEVQLVSRQSTQEIWSYTILGKHDLSEFDLIVNTTPLGMTPYEEEIPAINLSQIKSSHIVYDLIYNPALTPLLKVAKEQGAACINGKAMLVSQAELSWNIWNDKLQNTL